MQDAIIRVFLQSYFNRIEHGIRIIELRITNSLNRAKLQWRFGFRDVPFGLSLLFPHRPSDNTARTKILDRTPCGNSQQPDRLCSWIAKVTAWLYSREPVLHRRIRVQHAIVAQGTNTRKSRSGSRRNRWSYLPMMACLRKGCHRHPADHQF